MVAYVYLYIGYVKYVSQFILFSSFYLFLTYLQTVHIFTLCSTPKASRPLESQINNKWAHFTASLRFCRISCVLVSLMSKPQPFVTQRWCDMCDSLGALQHSMWEVPTPCHTSSAGSCWSNAWISGDRVWIARYLQLSAGARIFCH